MNKYLPPRRRPAPARASRSRRATAGGNSVLRWIDRVLSPMNPAFSVILLTTAVGRRIRHAGLAGRAGRHARACRNRRWFGVAAILGALALSAVGLLASTLHLGHPERAWRAVSQWRSSWLSREGVLALLTNLPALGFAAAWASPARATA